jgi:ubiquinol-cytochrome c reductase cytochrome b subunit
MKFYNFIIKHIKEYPINKNLKYSYSIGLIIAFLIILQIITGLFLSSFYVPFAKYAAKSLDYINNEIINGYVIQRIHVIIASFIFILIYFHFLRAIYYKMYT